MNCDSIFGKNQYLAIIGRFPMLIRDVGNSLTVSACRAFDDSNRMGELVTCWPLLFSPFATMTHLVDGRKMGKRAASLFFLLM